MELAQLVWIPFAVGSMQLFSNSLESLRSPISSEKQIQQLSPAALAYIGDAVYELHIRTFYLLPPKRLQAYHQQVVAQVRAESQARHLHSLEPYLTEAEHQILKKGRNAAVKGPRRVAPEIYQKATSLETLIGYLYLTDPYRLSQLLERLNLDLKES